MWPILNVLLTRATNGLVIVGDMATMCRGAKVWEPYVAWAKREKVYMNGNAFLDLLHKWAQ